MRTKISKGELADIVAFEKFIEQPKCTHATPIGVWCKDCEKEMMLDFIATNLEDGLVDANEVAQAIREGAFTLREVHETLQRRYG